MNNRIFVSLCIAMLLSFPAFAKIAWDTVPQKYVEITKTIPRVIEPNLIIDDQRDPLKLSSDQRSEIGRISLSHIFNNGFSEFGNLGDTFQKMGGYFTALAENPDSPEVIEQNRKFWNDIKKSEDEQNSYTIQMVKILTKEQRGIMAEIMRTGKFEGLPFLAPFPKTIAIDKDVVNGFKNQLGLTEFQLSKLSSISTVDFNRQQNSLKNEALLKQKYYIVMAEDPASPQLEPIYDQIGNMEAKERSDNLTDTIKSAKILSKVQRMKLLDAFTPSQGPLSMARVNTLFNGTRFSKDKEERSLNEIIRDNGDQLEISRNQDKKLMGIDLDSVMDNISVALQQVPYSLLLWRSHADAIISDPDSAPVMGTAREFVKIFVKMDKLSDPVLLEKIKVLDKTQKDKLLQILKLEAENEETDMDRVEENNDNAEDENADKPDENKPEQPEVKDLNPNNLADAFGLSGDQAERIKQSMSDAIQNAASSRIMKDRPKQAKQKNFHELVMELGLSGDQVAQIKALSLEAAKQLKALRRTDLKLRMAYYIMMVKTPDPALLKAKRLELDNDLAKLMMESFSYEVKFAKILTKEQRAKLYRPSKSDTQ